MAVEEQEKASPRLAQFIEAMMLIILAFPQLPFWMWLDKLFQQSQCPPSTFLSGTLQSDWEMWAVVGVMLASALFLRTLIILFIPSLRNFLGYGDPGKRWFVWPGIFLLALTFAILLDIAADTSQFCLSETQITFHADPVAPMRHYDWTDVAKIESGCRKGQKGGEYDFDQHYVLIMNDGQTVNISKSIPDFEKAFDDITLAFLSANHHPPLNSANVQVSCGYRNVQLFLQHP